MFYAIINLKLKYKIIITVIKSVADTTIKETKKEPRQCWINTKVTLSIEEKIYIQNARN